ncbi:MAG: 4Fe-4S binding protein [Bacteroidia bacterium]
MALKITNDCINCGVCETECPNGAIYECGREWRFADGTSVSGTFTTKSGHTYRADDFHHALSDDYYYVAPEKCTECTGFYDEPQCATVCPIDCCILDPLRIETEDDLLEKKNRLHT